MKDISKLKLYATLEHPCSYLSNKAATTVFVDPNAKIDGELYSELSDYGFRRSGQHLYRPHCQQCQACVPVRIPVQDFRPNRSQKRCIGRNRDLSRQLVDHINTEEHYRLYERYITRRHFDGDMYPPSRQQYSDFLSSEWGVTKFLEFRSADRLLAVAVCDRLAHGLSAIYTFFDPDEPGRSLGTQAVLSQLELATEWELPYVYLGYWIRNCDKMNYKSTFRPLQMYVNQTWTHFD